MAVEVTSSPDVDSCVLCGKSGEYMKSDGEEVSTPFAVDSAVVGDAEGNVGMYTTDEEVDSPLAMDLSVLVVADRVVTVYTNTKEA